MNAKHRQIYIPSPDELKSRCAAIQSAWTPTERRKRAVIRTRHWTPPMVRGVDLQAGRGTALMIDR